MTNMATISKKIATQATPLVRFKKKEINNKKYIKIQNLFLVKLDYCS